MTKFKQAKFIIMKFNAFFYYILILSAFKYTIIHLPVYLYYPLMCLRTYLHVCRFEITGFPTIKFFPAGSDEPEPYEENRELEDLVTFLNAKAGMYLGGG
jgi:hypothetical protein